MAPPSSSARARGDLVSDDLPRVANGANGVVYWGIVCERTNVGTHDNVTSAAGDYVLCAVI